MFLGTYGYTKKQFLTGNELEFFNRLRSACGPSLLVLPQVSMGALMNTTLKESHPRFWEARNKFSQKIVDFVICDAKSVTVLLLVELDDKTHQKTKDAQRDSISHLAGYRTLRYWSRNKPSVSELKQHIEKELRFLSS